MIKQEDLLEAIAECQGEKNPNANTCMKLAAYYVILDHIKGEEMPRYSYSEPPFLSGSEFSEAMAGKNTNEVLLIVDELMETVQVLVPRLYRATIEKIKDL